MKGYNLLAVVVSAVVLIRVVAWVVSAAEVVFAGSSLST